MKVGELKKLLENYPDDMLVLSCDNDDWYYDHSSVNVRKIYEGRRNSNSKDAVEVLCLE